MMGYSRKMMWEGVTQIPPAPLIGEQLTTIDFDFMKTKIALSKEYPVMTLEEISESVNHNKTKEEDVILAKLMVRGQEKTVAEIHDLIRRDLHHRKKVNLKSKPLGSNLEKLQLLAAGFSESESFVAKRELIEFILMRLKLAENFRRDEDYWLAEQVILTCFDNLGDHVMGVPLENRPVLSELFLSTAFLLYIQHQTGSNIHIEEEIIQYLKKSIELSQDKKDRRLLSSKTQNFSKREGVVKLVVDRPIALHGWRNCDELAKENETITLDTTSVYRTACIMYSLMLLQQINRRRQNQKDPSDKTFLSEIDHAFLEALLFSIEGENNSTFFHVLYVYGQYLFRQGMIDKANQIFNQIQTKALLINDLESLGISYNCLGLMCYRQFKIRAAVEHLTEEWEIGMKNGLPTLQIDALLDLGKLFLEEGRPFEMEGAYAQAYQELKAIFDPVTKSKNMEHITNERYDCSWIMASVSSGQAIWARFAGHCRKQQVQHILNWQTSRHPLPYVANISYKPESIQPSKIDETVIAAQIERELSLEGSGDSQNKAENDWAEEFEDKAELQHDILTSEMDILFKQSEYERSNEVFDQNEETENIIREIFAMLQSTYDDALLTSTKDLEKEEEEKKREESESQEKEQQIEEASSSSSTTSSISPILQEDSSNKEASELKINRDVIPTNKVLENEKVETKELQTISTYENKKYDSNTSTVYHQDQSKDNNISLGQVLPIVTDSNLLSSLLSLDSETVTNSQRESFESLQSNYNSQFQLEQQENNESNYTLSGQVSQSDQSLFSRASLQHPEESAQGSSIVMQTEEEIDLSDIYPPIMFN